MSFQLSLENLIRFILNRKENIIENLCDGKLDIHDTFCGRTSMSKCFLCSSLSRYLTSDSTFTIESGSYAGYTLRKKIFPDVKISTSSTSKSVLSDKFTQKLIISDLTENILLDHKIPCNITFGSVCSNIGYLYELSLGSLTFDKMCEQPELVRPLKESKIVIVSRPDTRVPLKASTVESIIFNLIEIFQSLIGKVLLGFPTKKDLSFLLKGRTITIDNVAIESRISCVLSVPDYSSSLINCSGKSLLVSTDLPFERSESMYSLNQNIIGDVNETFFRIKNKDKFEKLHQTGLIDFNLGMSVSFLTLLLSLSAEYPFISSLIADAVLLNIWSFIWDPQDMTIIDNKIIEWLNSPDEVSTSNILSLLSTINIRKNVITDLSNYLQNRP